MLKYKLSTTQLNNIIKIRALQKNDIGVVYEYEKKTLGR